MSDSDKAVAEMKQMQADTLAINLATQRMSTSNSNVNMVSQAALATNNQNVDVVKTASNDMKQQAKQA